jgi:hypothetical protein
MVSGYADMHNILAACDLLDDGNCLNERLKHLQKFGQRIRAETRNQAYIIAVYEYTTIFAELLA